MEHKRDLRESEQAFLGAVERSVISEIQTDFDPQAVNALNTDIEAAHLFLLGEKHGVQENTDIIYTLFKKFGFQNLALEWHPNLQETVKTFLDTGTLDFKAIKDSPDGRITAGHFSLLKKLKDEGLLENIICFDASVEKSWDDRDAQMAKNILANLSAHPTLVVAGNLHTKTVPIDANISYKTPDMNHPMGEHIKQQIPDVPTGLIDPLSGKFYNYGVKKIEKRDGDQARFYRSHDGSYIFEIPEAHTAIVPNTEETL